MNNIDARIEAWRKRALRARNVAQARRLLREYQDILAALEKGSEASDEALDALFWHAEGLARMVMAHREARKG